MRDLWFWGAVWGVSFIVIVTMWVVGSYEDDSPEHGYGVEQTMEKR